MARYRITDPIQSYLFWLVDVTPSPSYPFFALDPLAGFSSVSSPEFNVENQSYRPLNSMYPVFIAKSANVNPITLRRGASITNEDFYRWVTRHIDGVDATRRNLLLIQFHPMSVQAMAQMQENMATLLTQGLDVGAPFGGFARVPARVWILWGAVPTRYTAGEMDAKTSDVALSELSLQPERVVEATLGSLSL